MVAMCIHAQELKGLIQQQQQRIAKIDEEVRYLKLELLNREENFNRKFGGPEVGYGLSICVCVSIFCIVALFHRISEQGRRHECSQALLWRR